MAFFDILIVDDDPINREILKARLSKMDYTLDVAVHGAQAIEKMSQHQFGVVITDLMMPEVDGLNVLETVKMHYPQTDVIIMTAYATVENAVAALQQGAADFLQKPVNFTELNIRLQKLALIRSLTRNAGDLQTAIETTSKNAAQTILTLENMVVDLQQTTSEVERILLDEQTDIQKRIAHVIALLKKTRNKDYP
jgi:DNA-binding NtrC family response regulator